MENITGCLSLGVFILLLNISGAKAVVLANFDEYNKNARVEKIVVDPNVRKALKHVLLSDFNVFINNFDVLGEPHKTKAGGIFIEGWLQDLYLYQASAFVIEPGGKIYAAWLVPDNDSLQYRSNDQARKDIQEDIGQWALRFKGVSFSAKNIPASSMYHPDQVSWFENSHFKIKITADCQRHNTVCNDFLYEGNRKSDNAALQLKGKAIRANCDKDICPVLSYRFKNDNSSYILGRDDNSLTIIMNNKIVLSEKGEWSETQ
ncbi:hypothetical protein [Pantoea sp. B65]|uniref:hypothetical protein n=1 Tax=Pantoea sp. B65 TaxID=2813359 RepID=UPI0039B47A50